MADKKSNTPNKDKKPAFNFYWIYAIIAVILIGLVMVPWNSNVKEISESDFTTELLEKNFVDKVEIVDKKIVKVTLNKEGIESSFYKDKKPKNNSALLGPNEQGPQFFFKPLFSENFADKLDAWKAKYDFELRVSETDTTSRDLLWSILPIIIIVGLWIYFMRRMSGGGGGGGSQIFSIGKSKAQVFGQGKSTNVGFKDVAGLEGAKEEVEEIVEFLKFPKKFTELGAKIPKGALLVGPPGTGKTLLAKAVAGEANVPFFSLSGSDFVEMFVGVGASRVRDLFKQAKEKAPCIIFIDEIDAIGKARGRNSGMSSNDEHENTLNQLLTEMDGFGTNSGVIILAATNRADVLDKALMRAGRFDRQIYVDMPDINERKEIFEVHLKPLKTEQKLDADFLSRQTPGFSGADIANICNEAALIAARKKKKFVEMQDFLDAVDRIVGGIEKKNKIITPREKKTIAFHEAGHATVSWMTEHANPLIKVTIVPRGKSLGAAWYLPEERQITTTEQLLDEMCAALGGRAAEKLIFNKISTGALSDLEKVTKQAQAMVTVYGLNEKVGNVSYYDSQGNNSFVKPYSEHTARVIDEEIKEMIEIQYERAIKILSDNKEKLNELAELLLEKEVIFKDDLVKIFGKRPWDKEPVILKKEEPVAEAKTEVEESTEDLVETKTEDIKESEAKDKTEESTKESSAEPKE
ncbi:MAG: ATP-dependent metalloprotease FtsH [Flavobacteriales bacterium]|jgi:ATP-dependent metalloprotease FtsH